MGLNVHLDRVFLDNAKKTGPEIQRKNNFIINTGDNLTAKEREKRINMNKERYGLTLQEIKSLKLPKAVGVQKDLLLSLDQIFNAKSNFSVVEKLHHLEILKEAIEKKVARVEKAKRLQQMKKKYKSLDLAIVVEKVSQS
mmetsp:Transcript_2893/g.2722  ORF Transcript_2893/g.2722 Transcript_2893/m.2722 type:complete len:140 (-) Transcript_2893:96-515(-)